MADSDLIFTLKMKDEASQALKALQSAIDQVGVAAGGLTEKTKAHTQALGESHAAIRDSSDALREASYAARLLGLAHEQVTEKLTESARELRGLLSLFKEFGTTGLAAGGPLALISGYTVEAIANFSQYERMGVRLRAELHAIGQKGKISLGKLKDAGFAPSSTTIFNPDQIIQSGIALAKYATLSKEQIQGLLPVVADFAAATGQGAAQAASMLAAYAAEPDHGHADDGPLYPRRNRGRTRARQAVDGGDAVPRENFLPIVEHQTVTQGQLPASAVVLDLHRAGHLRLDAILGVHAEERVEHEVTVVAGGVDGGPDRIDDR